MIADSALALVFFALEVVTFVSSPREERWPQLVVGFLICLPVVWRRKYPRVSAASILSMSYFATLMMWATGDPAAEHPGLLRSEFRSTHSLRTSIGVRGRYSRASLPWT